MGLLVELVRDTILGCRGTGAEGGVRVFGDLLVGSGGSLGGSTLDGLRDVVGGVPRISVRNEASRFRRTTGVAYLTVSIAKVVCVKLV